MGNIKTQYIIKIISNSLTLVKQMFLF